jgi:hypothetical protein
MRKPATTPGHDPNPRRIDMKPTQSTAPPETGLRSLVALAVATAVAASAAAGALAATRHIAAIHRCGTLSAGGATWQVSASSSVSCTNARAIVKKLGSKPTPAAPMPYYTGIYLGMRCLGAKKNGHRLIDCGGTGGRAVAAVATS